MKPLREGDRVPGLVQWENVAELLIAIGILAIAFGGIYFIYRLGVWFLG